MSGILTRGHPASPMNTITVFYRCLYRKGLSGTVDNTAVFILVLLCYFFAFYSTKPLDDLEIILHDLFHDMNNFLLQFQTSLCAWILSKMELFIQNGKRSRANS